MEISKFDAQKKISILWLVNAGILTLIFILFTVFDRFDDQPMKGWEWYSQNIIPIVSLMLGTFYININKPQRSKKINIFYFRLSYSISLFYLFVIYLTILLAPVAFVYANISMVDLLSKSKIYLIIIQGLLTYSLGLFFNKES